MTTKTFTDSDSTYTMTKTAGSIIALFDLVLPELGWTKEFSGTNVAAYRNSTTAAGSSGCYMRVVNTNASYAQVRMFKTMSDIDTGTDPAPSTSQQGGDGLYIRTGDAWRLIGDERTFYLNISDGGVRTAYYFGDYDSLVPGNSYNYGISAPHNTENYSQDALVYINGFLYRKNCIARDPTTLASNSSTIFILNGWRDSTSGDTFYQPVGPNPYTGMYYVLPAFMRTENADIFGRMRGVYEIANRRPTDFYATIPWTGSDSDLWSFSTSGERAGGVAISRDDWP